VETAKSLRESLQDLRKMCKDIKDKLKGKRYVQTALPFVKASVCGENTVTDSETSDGWV
jgi:hypothetical protein